MGQALCCICKINKQDTVRHEIGQRNARFIKITNSYNLEDRNGPEAQQTEATSSALANFFQTLCFRAFLCAQYLGKEIVSLHSG